MPRKSSLAAFWPFPVPRTIEEARKTYEGRVAWALQYRWICTYEDHDEVGIPIPTFTEDSVFADIEPAQRRYDHEYREKRKKLEKRKKDMEKKRMEIEEKKKKLEEENHKWLAKLREKFGEDLDMILSEVVKKSSSNSVQKRPREDDDDGGAQEVISIASPAKKVARRSRNLGKDLDDDIVAASSKSRIGTTREPPCLSCQRKEIICHNQEDENNDTCFECSSTHLGCLDTKKVQEGSRLVTEAEIRKAKKIRDDLSKMFLLFVKRQEEVLGLFLKQQKQVLETFSFNTIDFLTEHCVLTEEERKRLTAIVGIGE